MAETLFISTTPGLEPALLSEARALGEARLIAGGVRLAGGDGLHRQANLWLRCASRVLLEIAVLPVRSPADLRSALATVDLSRFLTPSKRLELEVLNRGGLPAQALHAAAKVIRGGGSLRLRSQPGTVVVMVDTTGELLHRRGYRQEGSQAPLRETLAAGILKLAQHAPEEPIWDPLCGSGTLAIEAALMSRRIAAGIRRRFAFELFPSHDARAYLLEKAAAAASCLADTLAPIWASDLNAGSLGTARRNALRAGVQADLKLFRHDARRPAADLPPGTLAISNLPYGKRAGKKVELPALYRQIADSIRRSGAARMAVLAADPGAAEWLGLERATAHPVENGGLKCRLLVTKL